MTMLDFVPQSVPPQGVGTARILRHYLESTALGQSLTKMFLLTREEDCSIMASRLSP